MQFYVHGFFGAVPVFIRGIDEDGHPDDMTRHIHQSRVFDTNDGDSMALLCHQASDLYQGTFYPQPLAPQIPQDEFDALHIGIESEVISTYQEMLYKYFGPHNATAMFLETSSGALKDLPAFRNCDVLRDFRLILSRRINRLIYREVDNIADIQARHLIGSK